MQKLLDAKTVFKKLCYVGGVRLKRQKHVRNKIKLNLFQHVNIANKKYSKKKTLAYILAIVLCLHENFYRKSQKQ